ncbi:MAG: helix-turn-helix transcriptional regulator [Gemmatimonadota bacterium]|nr:helix-turn-helix transcriptional regulator [Gemmatimonadota bacterium]
MSKNATSDAVTILRKRVIGTDFARTKRLAEEHWNVRVAQMIYDCRVAADLSQRELADRIGTTQSVISRLENSDYQGHSLAMLQRIAQALGHELRVDMVAPENPGGFRRPTNGPS